MELQSQARTRIAKIHWPFFTLGIACLMRKFRDELAALAIGPVGPIRCGRTLTGS